MSSLQYLQVVVCLLILTELTSFVLSFVWLKVSSYHVLSEIAMDEGIRSGKSLILGMAEAPQGNIQGDPSI